MGQFGTRLYPDDFMFRQFRRHSAVLSTGRRSDYFMLSSGANFLPTSDVWRELLAVELDHDLAYQWYTSARGFPGLTAAARLAESIIASGALTRPSPSLGEVCMTLGASQAVAAVFDFVAQCCDSPRVLLVGYNYALFERQARHYHMGLLQLAKTESQPCTLPDADAIRMALADFRPHLVILTVPNNPTGELYDAGQFAEILRACGTTDAIVLIDKVGQLPISYDPWINVGRSVLALGMQDRVIQISSFSKTDSVPGFRVGYVIGPPRVIRHVEAVQHLTLMNPPTVPLLPIYFSFMARSIHALTCDGASAPALDRVRRLFVRLFHITTAIAPDGLYRLFDTYLMESGPASAYQRYVDCQVAQWRDVQANYAYVRQQLASSVTAQTDFRAGFNLLIQLEQFAGKDEDTVCREVLDATGVALLTESCFMEATRPRRNFWVRVSLAAPPSVFSSAVERFGRFLTTY